MKQYSIKDIAKLSGYSIATVSRVINNKGKYSKKTENIIKAIIEETGFNINSSAQSLRTSITKTIGIITPDISNNFFSDLVQKIEEGLFEKGYSTVICNTSRNLNKEKDYLRVLESKNVDGIIIISGNRDKEFEFKSINKNIPYICIDREPKDTKDTIFISSDHYNGALNATNSLFIQGSKNPAIIQYNYKSSTLSQRLKGFIDSLNKNGINFTYNNSCILDDNEDIENTIYNFIKSNPRIDSFFAINDLLAIKLIKVLQNLGYKIPNDYMIIGFDDIEACNYINPSLSTVHQNTNLIASSAIENIINSINGNQFKGKIISIPTKIILRDSTKKRQ